MAENFPFFAVMKCVQAEHFEGLTMNFEDLRVFVLPYHV